MPSIWLSRLLCPLLQSGQRLLDACIRVAVKPVREDDLEPPYPSGHGIKFFARQERPAVNEEVVQIVGLRTTIQTSDE